MPANLEVILEEKLVAVKDEFHMLLDKWCQTKLGLSVKDAESVVISNPMAMFADFHGFYLIHRKEARKCVSLMLHHVAVWQLCAWFLSSARKWCMVPLPGLSLGAQ